MKKTNCTVHRAARNITFRSVAAALLALFFGFISSGFSKPDEEPVLDYSIVWQTPIRTTGSPALFKDKVFVGAVSSAPNSPRFGKMLCINSKNGELLGQVEHAPLQHCQHDVGIGIVCRPCIEDGRAHYVSNRGELVCLAADKFGAYGKSKIIWSLDMVEKLGVFKKEARDCGNPLSSPIIIGDLVYCVTGNGSTYGYPTNGTFGVPAPDAPSFIAVNKFTGKVVWSSAAPGKNIQYGQWASPAHAKVDGKDQVIFPGGDGWLYGFEAETGRQVWKVDCNPATATASDGRKVGTRNNFMAAPAVRNGVAYIGTSFDQEQTDRVMPIYAVDITQKGDATRKGVKWTFYDEEFAGTFVAVALGKDSLYAAGCKGWFVCLDLTTGKERWRYDLGMDTSRFGSPVVHQGRVNANSGDDIVVFEDSPTKKCLGA